MLHCLLQVYDDTRGTDSPLSGHVDIPADHAQGDIDFTIDTDGWEPGFYKVGSCRGISHSVVGG